MSPWRIRSRLIAVNDLQCFFQCITRFVFAGGFRKLFIVGKTAPTKSDVYLMQPSRIVALLDDTIHPCSHHFKNSIIRTTECAKTTECIVHLLYRVMSFPPVVSPSTPGHSGPAVLSIALRHS